MADIETQIAQYKARLGGDSREQRHPILVRGEIHFFNPNNRKKEG
jgi:hypothetical protein